MRIKRLFSAAAAVILLISMCTVLAGCGYEIEADISSYQDMEIRITGLTDENFIVTPAQLAELKCEKETVKGAATGKTITATAAGPTLAAFTEANGVELEEIKSVTVTASDGYTKTFDADYFITHPDVYMSLANGENALEKDEQPMRLIVPGAPADNWVRGVVQMDFVR